MKTIAATSRVRSHHPTSARDRAARRPRTPAPAVRAAAVLFAVIALTIPAHFTLRDDPAVSGVIAAATAYGAAALLSIVLAAAIWRVMRAHALSPALAGVLAVFTASALPLYAALTLIWEREVGPSHVEVPLAAAQTLLGVHLVLMAVATARLRSAPVFPAALALSGFAVLVAVFPPTWYPQTADALMALTAGQLTLATWFLTHRFAPKPQMRLGSAPVAQTHTAQ